MNETSNNKVMGIEVNKYVNICYMLILISSGFGLLGGLAGLGGIHIPGAIIFGLVGLAGLVLVLLGLFLFKDNFNAVDISHIKYLAILFGAFFVVGIILGSLLGGLGYVGLLLILIVSALQFVLFFAGFKLHKAGAEAQKDAVIDTIKSGFKV